MAIVVKDTDLAINSFLFKKNRQLGAKATWTWKSSESEFLGLQA